MSKQVNTFLVYCLMLCITFEEMFGRMKWSLSSVKYVLILVLTVMIYFNHRKKKQIYMPKEIYFFCIMMVVYLVLSVFDFLRFGFAGLNFWKGFCYLPLFVYIFLNTNLICTLNSTDLIRIFINCMVLYCIFNFLLFFIDVPIWKASSKYWGRIGVGYSTIDTVTMSLTLVLLWFYDRLNYRFYYRLFASVLIILSILGLASGTGIVCLFIVFVAAIFYSFKGTKHINTSYSKKTKKIILSSILFIIFSFSSIVLWLQNYDYDLFQNINIQFENRLNILLQQENKSVLDRNTMEQRDWRLQNALSKDFTSQVFGDGFGRLTNEPIDISVGSTHYFLESLYHVFRKSMGWFGTLWFYAILFALLIKSFQMKHSMKYVYIPFLAMCISSSFTSVNLCSVGIAGALGLVVADLNLMNKTLKA